MVVHKMLPLVEMELCGTLDVTNKRVDSVSTEWNQVSKSGKEFQVQALELLQMVLAMLLLSISKAMSSITQAKVGNLFQAKASVISELVKKEQCGLLQKIVKSSEEAKENGS